ncbi:pilus assembly protein TadG-related protein [Streptomyces sp. DW26H14]|uniref:pilus assembly protein TadG-related protein n=1 Tax=Streptomyces sp. DW26H14 TaxID=3435395 RepID=UPI00403D5ED2
MTRSYRDSGQAAPLYIVMVAGLLFAALAFFVFGQAGATRNGGQSAADAAALAAAQQSRDDLRDGLLAGALEPGFLTRLFGGSEVGPAGNACAAASTYAAANDATVRSCATLGDGRWGFRVGVVTQNSVGKSVVPGTENQKANAVATAVVEPRCAFVPSGQAPQGSASAPEAGSPPSAGGGNQKPPPAVSPGDLRCPGDSTITIDPQHLEHLPDMADLFTVRLVDNPS